MFNGHREKRGHEFVYIKKTDFNDDNQQQQRDILGVVVRNPFGAAGLAMFILFFLLVDAFPRIARELLHLLKVRSSPFAFDLVSNVKRKRILQIISTSKIMSRDGSS